VQRPFEKTTGIPLSEFASQWREYIMSHDIGEVKE
jgi:hypothetical protein